MLKNTSERHKNSLSISPKQQLYNFIFLNFKTLKFSILYRLISTVPSADDVNAHCSLRCYREAAKDEVEKAISSISGAIVLLLRGIWLRCFIHRLISPMHRTDVCIIEVIKKVCIDASNFQPMNGIKQHLGE